MHAPSAAAFAVIVGMLTTSTAMAIEEPGFQVLENDGSFELREYAPYIVAETRVEASFQDAGSIAFQRLFRYISGNNVAQQKIAMTAPVTQSRGEKIAMTAPVSQVADGRAFLVAFTLPSTYTLATAPKPLDTTIQIREVPAQVIACWRYSGRWTVANYRQKEALLRERIKARGLVADGDAVLARYNSPFTPWFLRRNEVLIPVAPLAKR
ncbi:MAG: heme-binding protein [Steroidobacteraceae bacterium]|nr:heme-binding protein [Steroidobacteraceae bacterium]